MIAIPKTPKLNKDELVENIKDIFIHFENYSYQRVLLEFFSPEGCFIGDNVVETTFALREKHAPLIYEVSGPFDAFSNQYPTLARVFLNGDLVYQCDLKPGILQRTAAMVWLYFDVLKHTPRRVLLYGSGKLSTHIGDYLKHFVRDLDLLDYCSRNGRQVVFEEGNKNNGLETRFNPDPDLSAYDTILMATNTNTHILNSDRLNRIQPGSFVVSLCTTSQTGEIAEDVYGREDVNVFLDYPETKRFTPDMKRADEAGYLTRAILFSDTVKRPADYDLNSRINLIRLTGTPMQNIAVIRMMMAQDSVAIKGW